MKYTVEKLLTYIRENNIPLDTPIGIFVNRGTLLEVIKETNPTISAENYFPINDKYADVVLPVYNKDSNLLFISTQLEEDKTEV